MLGLGSEAERFDSRTTSVGQARIGPSPPTLPIDAPARLVRHDRMVGSSVRDSAYRMTLSSSASGEDSGREFEGLFV